MPGHVQIKVAEENNRPWCVTSQDKGLEHDRPWEVAGICLCQFKVDGKLGVKEAGGFGLPVGEVQLWLRMWCPLPWVVRSSQPAQVWDQAVSATSTLQLLCSLNI